MKVTSTRRDTHYVKFTVYGASGVGKTVLCSTAPSPLILSAEAGLLSLADKDIPTIEINNIKELHEAYAYVKDHLDEYDTICLDSISDIAEQCLDNALLTLGKKAKDEGKQVEPRQAYGKMAMEMQRLAKAFRQLASHVVFTAKQGYVTDDVANTLRFGPMIPGQAFTQQVPYLMDILCCMRVTKEGTRYLQTQPDLQYGAKDRSGKLDEKERPDLTLIFNKVVGKNEASKD